MDPPWLLNLIVLVTLASNLDFIKRCPYDLDEKILNADFINVRYYWMIFVHENTFSQVYLSAHAINSNIHVTSHYKVRWLTKHGDYLQEGMQHVIDHLTPPHVKSKTTKKIENNFGSGSKKICSFKTEERPMGKIEESTKCMLNDLTSSARFKLLDRDSNDNVGKESTY